MNYYKFISEAEIKKYSGGFVIVDNVIYTNPQPEQLFKAGYKPLVPADDPEYDADIQYIVVTYSERKNDIKQIKTVVDITTENEGAIE